MEGDLQKAWNYEGSSRLPDGGLIVLAGLVSDHPRTVCSGRCIGTISVHSEMVDFAGGQGGWPV